MADALPLLQALEGHGLSAEQVNRSGWVGGFDDDGISYSSGPAPGAVLDLNHYMSGFITPVWDVIGVINGTSSDDVVVIGNHRDAWVIGGAADPNSGTAVLVELAKAFGKLLETGWKPKRTMLVLLQKGYYFYCSITDATNIESWVRGTPRSSDSRGRRSGSRRTCPGSSRLPLRI